MKVEVSKQDIQGIIDAHVAAAVTKSLTDNKGEILETLVTSALNEKQSSYSRETKLVSAAKDMIRVAAKEAMTEWVESQRDVIKRAVTKRLKATKAGFVDEVADKIVSGMASNFYVTANLKVMDDE